jgi:hypothetical protein
VTTGTQCVEQLVLLDEDNKSWLLEREEGDDSFKPKHDFSLKHKPDAKRIQDHTTLICNKYAA